MNIEDYREYCLSLGDDIEEKLPFTKFKSGEGVLVFYVCGHMFSFFDCNDFHVISLASGFMPTLFPYNYTATGLMSGKNQHLGNLYMSGSIGCIDRHIGNIIAS